MTIADSPVCYIIMRTDIASLNPGKAMAQAHHAYGVLYMMAKYNTEFSEAFDVWRGSTNHNFGTTIVLGGSKKDIIEALGWESSFDSVHEEAVRSEWSFDGPLFLAGWVRDPSYPIKDGDVTHHVALDTCAFMFGYKSDCFAIAERFPLHP